MKKEPKYNYVDNYLTEVQAMGRYTVTLSELKSRFNVSEKAILQNIYRLKRKNQLAHVRKEFYVIIPPQYSIRGMVPTTLFIADMMDYLDRDYYIGLLSAAALHGAGHQQPMVFQVMTKKPPLRNIKNQKLNVSFYTISNWEWEQIIEKKSETGYLKVSSPELTAFDLVNHNKKIGGVNRILPILEELSEIIKPSALVKVAKTQKIPNIQRLGYLLDELDNESLANSLFKLLDRKLKNVSLSLAHKENKELINEKWRIDVNIDLDL